MLFTDQVNEGLSNQSAPFGRDVNAVNHPDFGECLANR